MQLPKVTAIITQRERFCFTQTSLESILSDNSYPFEIVYVDCGSPAHIRAYLQQRASQHDRMKLIRREGYLRVNEARNLGLAAVESADYVVFLDNDVIVEPGWLKSLIDCAIEERADLVAPLVLEGDPHLSEKIVHIAGATIESRQKRSGKSSLLIHHHLHHAKLPDRAMSRSRVDVVEFHCVLMRRSLLEKVTLDKQIGGLSDYVDLCLQAKAAGAIVYVEPNAIVTFLNPLLVSGFDRDDLRFHQYRWGERLTRDTIVHLQRKWNLEAHDPFLWKFWRWAIAHRQLPIKSLIAKSSLRSLFLNVCKLRFCPSWLRIAIERSILSLTFPRSGIPCNLSNRIAIDMGAIAFVLEVDNPLKQA